MADCKLEVARELLEQAVSEGWTGALKVAVNEGGAINVWFDRKY